MSMRRAPESSATVALVELHAQDPAARRAAIAALDSDSTAIYALRTALLLDEDASVRAQAAVRLGSVSSMAGSGISSQPDRADERERRDYLSAVQAALGWLEEATADSHPTVRLAAVDALRQAQARAVVPRLVRMCLYESAWPVRRAAVLALAAIAREDAVDTLLAVLGDPFWRVRHAAIRALAVLGSAEPSIAERVLAAPQPSVEIAGAVEFLRRGWSGEVLPHLEPVPRPVPIRRADATVDPAWDADPAVVAARLDEGQAASTALLIDALVDSHEPLRKAAMRRLHASADARAYQAALLWLDEPRVPHAAETVHALLEQAEQTGAQSELIRELVEDVLEGEEAGSGARIWALGWVARAKERALLPAVVAHARWEHAEVRSAALATVAVALAEAGYWGLYEPAGDVAAHERAQDELLAGDHELTQDRLVAALAAGLQDHDTEVRLAAVSGLARVHEPMAGHALASLCYAEQPVAIRRVLVAVYAESGAAAALHEAARDTDGTCRAQALAALASAGLVPDELGRAAAEDVDPWVRMAVMTEASALRALGAEVSALGAADSSAGDPDPEVRQAAIRWIWAHSGDSEIRSHAGRVSASARDPLVRARACALLAEPPGNPVRARRDAQAHEHLILLLRLSADPELMVRAAAADALAAYPELDARLTEILAFHAEPTVRKAAYTWLGRALDQAAFQHLTAVLARGSEPPEVAEHLRAMLIACPDPAISTTSAAQEQSRGSAARAIAAASAPRFDTAARTTAPAARSDTAATAAPVHDTAPVIPYARPLGSTGIAVAPLAISGAFDLGGGSLLEAYRAGVNLYFWEPRYQALTRFVRASAARRQRLVLTGGSYHGSARAIQADVDRALRRLGTDYLDVFLLFWVRSSARLEHDAVRAALMRMKQQGKVRAIGFSTHDRAIATHAITTYPWDVVMVRHSAAHRGAESDVFPVARERGVGVLTFSALCYGRMLSPVPGARPEAVPSAADCYRYSLSHGGVSACISAPRRHGELMDNLAVLAQPTLDTSAMEALRQHGRLVYERNKDFNALVRREARALPGVGLAERLAELAGELMSNNEGIAPDKGF